MFQISSSCNEWWSPFACSLWFDLFHDVFWVQWILFEKCIDEAVDSTMFQSSSSCVGWWYSFVRSLRFDLFHCVFERYKLCLENAWRRLSIEPFIRSRWAVSDGGFLLSVAYGLTCFMRFFSTLWTLLRKCMNEAVDSTIYQISSSCVGWWSSFVCSLWFDLFHEVFSTL